MAKRRAAARRRNRERIRQIGAIFFVLLFVLGTATSIFVFQQPVTPAAPATAQTGDTGQNAPPATVPPAGNAIQITPNPNLTPGNQVLSDLVKQADDAANAGKWPEAISLYKSALGLTSGNASVEYSLGKAYAQTQDYANAVDHLQKAVDLNPQASFAGDAQNLINTYKSQVTPGAGGAGTSPATPVASPTQ